MPKLAFLAYTQSLEELREMEGINPLRDSAERLPAGAELCLLGRILWACVCSTGVPIPQPICPLRL